MLRLTHLAMFKSITADFPLNAAQTFSADAFWASLCWILVFIDLYKIFQKRASLDGVNVIVFCE